MNLLFHVHSNQSYDSFLNPKKIIDWAVSNKIKNIAITDHDTIKNIMARDYAKMKQLDINVIIGAEYKTDCGDIIALFIENEIHENNSLELIKKFTNLEVYDFTTPYHSHKLSDKIIKSIDLIEIFNARLNEDLNEKAKILSLKYNKPVIVGNDAHVYGELKLFELFRKWEEIKSLF